ncbi:MAG: toll/interleukin-1 receptor domain-containing protein [Methanobrevibacter sp.]|uniref:toll/interleukin-1 receptor domain-containing protein n=1 Tax=Methanobrevibacter sp. TaxID=66852 RepID=UPI0025F18F68|nr:toll/interleukin-1 receptor domain-containing protein [Methanobrevibacter sp.]MBR0271087.1 toll/interleukin-1 receptor domain-containing protein [Methanobrevibacter sp.]
MEELFTEKIDEFIHHNLLEIQKKINAEDCLIILNNDDEYINSLIKSYYSNNIEVDFDKIDYTKKTDKKYDYYGNPIKLNRYSFKVPYKGDSHLLNYRPKKGLYREKTYFSRDNYIYFESLNFDINHPNPKFYNSIETLKSIIDNLTKEYSYWNDSLKEYIENNVNYRKNILLNFKKFCKKYGLSEKEIMEMGFKLAALETLSKIIADTYPGSDITVLFKKSGFPEIVYTGDTKWKFLCETFEIMQEECIEGFYKILKVIEVVCDPQEYLLNPELHKEILEKINMILVFYGFKFNEEGILLKLDTINNKFKKSINKNSNHGEDHYDVFISHSSTDKPWVDELNECLSKTDLKIWYDASILKIGDNIRKKINQGLINSDYGIIVLSKEFINRSWTNFEFDSLYPLIAEEKLLPINHGLSSDDLAQFFKPLLNTQYMDSDKYTIKEICDEIYSKIRCP